MGTKIGTSLGEFQEVDIASDGVGWGKCLRIRVSINLTKPLERGRALNLGGKSYWVNFKYEKLPMFCFHCWRIVHGSQGCPESTHLHLNSENTEKQWGVWFRAEAPRRRTPTKVSEAKGKPSTWEEKQSSGEQDYDDLLQKASPKNHSKPSLKE